MVPGSRVQGFKVLAAGLSLLAAGRKPLTCLSVARSRRPTARRLIFLTSEPFNVEPLNRETDTFIVEKEDE